MNKKIEEICEDKSKTKESAVNNECCENGINDGARTAANSPVPSLETIMEMFEGLQITPLSKINGISRSNHQNNYLFIDKPSYEKPSKKSNGQEEYIKWNENDVKVVAENGAGAVKSHNGLIDNQKPKDNLNKISSTALSVATINGTSLLGSTDNALAASEVLEDRKGTSSTASFTAPDVYKFTATPFYSSTKSKFNRFRRSDTVQQTGTSKADSIFVFGDQNMQALLANSISQISSGSPKISSSKSADVTKTQNTNEGPTIDTEINALSASVNSSLTSCFQNIKQSLLNSPAESSEVKTIASTFSTAHANGTSSPATQFNAIRTSENTGIIFNQTALMAMFDGTRKIFGTSIVQIPESTDLKLKKSQVSFPFRNKSAASAELASKKSLCSQKKLQENTSIANTEFKMLLPTFRSAQKNVTSIYIFGSQEIPGTIFDQISTSTSEKTASNGPVFDKLACMSYVGWWNFFATSTNTKSYLGKSPAQVHVTRLTNTFHKNKIDLFKYEDYKSALAMFDDAVQLCPDNDTLITLYGIRAHYYMKLGKYREAVTDIQKVISSDASFTDGYICLAKCYIALGETSAADDAIGRTRVADGDAEGARAMDALRELRALYDDMQRAIAAQDYARAVPCVDRFLELCPSNTAKATKAKCLAMLGETEKALKLAEECLHYHASEPEALYAKGLCFYYTGNDHKAVDYFQKVISVFPLHLGAIDSLQKANELLRLAKEEMEAFSVGDYEKVLTLNSEALAIDQSHKECNIKLHLQNAVAYTKLKKIQLAVKECTSALEIDKSNVRALKMRAECHKLLGQFQNAVKDYKKVYKIARTEANRDLLRDAKTLAHEKEEAFRDNVSSLESLVLNGEYQEALTLADKCLQVRSFDRDIVYIKGWCFYYMGQYEKALEHLQEILNTYLSYKALPLFEKITRLKVTIEQGDDLFVSGQWELARFNYRRAQNIDRGNWNLSVSMHCKLAEAYLKENKVNDAIKEYTLALKIDENCVEALLGRAKCFAEQSSKYENAIEDYQKIYSIDKCEDRKRWVFDLIQTLKEKEAHLRKIRFAESLIVSREAEDIERALNLAEECLRFDSSDTNALCVIASCLYYKEQYEEALYKFQQILLLEPNHSMAAKEIKKITCLMSTIKKGDDSIQNGRWDDALSSFSEALKIDGLNSNLKVRLHCKKAEIYLELNDVHSAINEYTNALTFDSNNVKALAKRAKCFTKLNLYEDAIKDFRNLCILDKYQQTVWHQNIIFLEKKIAYKEKLEQAENLIAGHQPEKLYLAQKLAEECLESDGSDTKALCVKGLCLYYKELYEEALDLFKQVLLLDPSNSTAVEQTKKISYIIQAIEEGGDSLRNCRWDDALNIYSEALKIDGLNSKLNFRLHCYKGEIYFEFKDDFDSAINEYTNALTIDSNDVKALAKRAKCFTKLYLYEDAIKDQEKLCKIDKYDEAFWTRNIVFLKKKIVYKEKLEQAENLIAGRQIEKLDLAQKLAEECLAFQCDGLEEPRALCVKGLCLYYKEEYEQALDLFQQVLLLDPSNSTAVEQTKKISYIRQTIEEGEHSLKNGRWQDALDKFNEALKIDIYHKHLKVRLFCKKAMTIKSMNGQNAHAAIYNYTKALVLDGECVEALFGRAQCYKELLQYEDAVKDCEKLYTIVGSEEIKQLLQKLHTALQEKNNMAAEEKSEAGNKLFNRKKFRDALSMYKQAISLDPDTAEYYSKTFACYINLSKLKEAFADAKKAVALDAKCSKSFGGIAKCYLALGDLSGAERAITKASDAGVDCTDERRALESLHRLHAQAQRYIAEQSYKRAVACMDQCLEFSQFSARAKLIKAECLVALGKVEQALEIADDCIRLDKSDIDALYVKGLCIYYNEKHEQALKYFKEVLRLSPDHVKATSAYKKAKLLMQKKEQGNEAFKAGRWQKALLLYNEALAVDPKHAKVNAKLNFNKATVYRKLNQTQPAADACTAALVLDENYVKALTLRAKCYTELGEYDCVIDDYEQLYKIEPSDEIKQLLDEAKRSHNKKSQCKNYYNILGLNRSATKSDIKRAYRQLSLVHHPDRHSGRSNFERKRQERRFKEVLEAYTVLSDPVNRRKYDSKGSRTQEDDDDDYWGFS